MPLVDVVHLSQSKCRYPIIGELKYATSDNFLGRPVNGYNRDAADVCLLASHAAESLSAVQNYLIDQHGLGLVIYEAYRPKKAVLDMLAWSKAPVDDIDLKQQAIYYPYLQKSELFARGYLAEDSMHCYGHAVDVFLIDPISKTPVDMGACFDFFGELSHLTAGPKDIGETAYRNRKILQEAMQKFGFSPYQYEFWHFSVENKTIHTPLDFIITSALKGC